MDEHVDHAAAVTLSISEDDSSSQTPAAGYIGAQAESVTATSVFEQTLGRDPTVQHDPELISALNSLRRLVVHNQHDASGSSRGLTATRLANAAPDVLSPGWEQVKALLERAEGTLSASLTTAGVLANTPDRSEAHDVQLATTRNVRRLLQKVPVNVRATPGKLTDRQTTNLLGLVQHLCGVHPG